MNSINTTITTATINATIINPVNITVNGLTMEIWHSKMLVQLQIGVKLKQKEIDPNQISNIKLDDLSPAEYYYVRFKYLNSNTYVYIYDKDSSEIGKKFIHLKH